MMHVQTKPHRPDLLVLVIVWQFIAAFLGLISFLIIAFLIAAQPILIGERVPKLVFMFAVSMAILILIIYFGLSIAAGIGLLKGKEWGRLLAMVHAGISIILAPVGIVFGVLVLIYLNRSEVREYFRSDEIPPRPRC